MAKVAVLCEKYFQDLELLYPKYRLLEADHKVTLVGIEKVQYTGKHGYPIQADISIDNVSAKEFDAIVIPGGWAPDYLRRNNKVLQLVAEMNKQKKPIAAICHGGWVLASANILKGRTATCFIAIKDDIINAGAKYIDKAVVVDGNLITSRTPDDLPAFMIELLKKLK
ncbi:MAG: type 1 glutamine amidotransferase [Candidatus Pacearchaeota archaeon]|nr:type 1 glutamine amidotransferase [Candidatus Pacearchaeota archaeon]